MKKFFFALVIAFGLVLSACGSGGSSSSTGSAETGESSPSPTVKKCGMSAEEAFADGLAAAQKKILTIPGKLA